MNSVYCKICNTQFLSETCKGKIEPWDCPKCNKDSQENIQKDLNELFKIVGLYAMDNISSRLDRQDVLSKMMWKSDHRDERGLVMY